MKKIYCLLLFMFISVLQVCAATCDIYKEALNVVKNNYYDIDSVPIDYKYWSKRYDKKIKTSQDSYIAIETFIASLDDHYTRFLNPEEQKYEMQVFSREVYYLGIEFQKKHGKYLLTPMPNSSAEEVGIQKNDILRKINNIEIDDKSIDEINKMLEVKNGEKVTLEIERKGVRKTYTVEKKAIRISTISMTPFIKTKIPKDICYFSISSFVDKQVSEEFNKLMKENLDKKAYIIDLRYNGGGTVKYAAEIANMLLKNKNIFTMIDKNGKKKPIDANEHLLSDKPVVVLINGGTASASEILAGALKDNKRATIIGEKSFGKGIMQKRVTLKDGSAINLTVYKYLTPSGDYIHKKGIMPDIEVKLTRTNVLLKNDKQLKKAIKVILNE